MIHLLRIFMRTFFLSPWTSRDIYTTVNRCKWHISHYIQVLGPNNVTSNNNATKLNPPSSNHDLFPWDLRPGDEFVELSGGCGVFCDSLELAAGPDKKKAPGAWGKGLADLHHDRGCMLSDPFWCNESAALTDQIIGTTTVTWINEGISVNQPGPITCPRGAPISAVLKRNMITIGANVVFWKLWTVWSETVFRCLQCPFPLQVASEAREGGVFSNA